MKCLWPPASSAAGTKRSTPSLYALLSALAAAIALAMLAPSPVHAAGLAASSTAAAKPAMTKLKPLKIPADLREKVYAELGKSDDKAVREQGKWLLDALQDPQKLDPTAWRTASQRTAGEDSFTPKSYDELLAEAKEQVARLKANGGQFTNDIKQQNADPDKYAFTSLVESRDSLNQALGSSSSNSRGIISPPDLGTLVSQFPSMAEPDIKTWAYLAGAFNSYLGILMGHFGLIDAAISGGDVGNIVLAVATLVNAVVGLVAPGVGMVVSFVIAIAQILYGAISGQFPWPWDRLDVIVSEVRASRDEAWKENLTKVLNEELPGSFDRMWQQYQQSVAYSVAQAEAVFDSAIADAPEDQRPQLTQTARRSKSELRDDLRNTLKEADFKDHMVETTRKAFEGFAHGDPAPYDGETITLRGVPKPTRVVDDASGRAVIHRSHGGANQQWVLQKYGDLWKLHSKADYSKCLGAWADKNGASAQVRECDYTNAQWRLEHIGGGRYALHNPKPHDDRTLEPLNKYAGGANGDQLMVWYPNHENKDYRMWYLDRSSQRAGFFAFTESFVHANRKAIFDRVCHAVTGNCSASDGSDHFRSSVEAVANPLLQDAWKTTPWLPSAADIDAALSKEDRFRPLDIPFVDPAAPEVETYAISASHSDLNLDAAADGRVLQYSKHNGANQQWEVKPLTGSGAGSVQLVEQQSGKCMATSSQKVVTTTCNAIYNDQWWQLERQSDGQFKIVHTPDKKVLDVPGGSTQSGIQLELYSDQGGLSQRFALTAVGGVSR